MDARFYNSEDIDMQRLASDLVNIYLSQGYQAQLIGNSAQTMVQIKKGGDLEALIGMQAAISLTLQRTTGGTLAMIGQQRWIDKAAVGAVGLVAFPVLWPLALTAGAGALRQASLGNQVLNVVDNLVQQQRPGVVAGPIPQYLMPQVQQQWGQPNNQQQVPYYIPSNQAANAPAPLPATLAGDLRCPHCNTPYEAGDTFCTGCGRALAAPRTYCSNCHSELKPGLSFCPKCGASTYQASPGAQQAIPRPGPAPQPASYSNTTPAPAPRPQTPVYQPPAQPQTPVYQPPAQPAAAAPSTPVYKPPTPVYQPPAQPPTPAYQPPKTQTPAAPPSPQVYYVPTNQPAQPSASQSTQKKPEEPYYVPPVTQEPPVKPQPKVTMVQGTPHQTPPPPKQQPRPQKQYYIPSNQAAKEAMEQVGQNPAEQPTIADQSRINAANQPTIAEQPALSINDQPTIKDSVDTGVPWATLTFEDGQSQQLSGEHVVIGRYDHDLGGLRPDIDLAKVKGSDTVSRVHATLENSGGSYLLTDLNSTNATRINGKRLEPDKPTPINDGDKITFGKVEATFKKI
jgi:pSer/pThr/pTyr-binding forkhead associated (FHA) protein